MISKYCVIKFENEIQSLSTDITTLVIVLAQKITQTNLKQNLKLISVTHLECK